ncbi:MAG: twin-arginine translocation pathway signal protein [Rhodobacteraceae bacterium]|nr:twin-arginine translocation pathway signal protein [Paracoccaceae bacterium]
MWQTLLIAILSSAFFSDLAARPAKYVPDPVSGYAIGGHDPVAYFVDNRPLKGDRKYVYRWSGVDWTFVNQGNMAAFEKAPLVYAPYFAGCGAYALAEGYATAGNPFIFAIIDQKLFFFHSYVNRFLFVVNAQQLFEDAKQNGPKVDCKPNLF